MELIALKSWSVVCLLFFSWAERKVCFFKLRVFNLYWMIVIIIETLCSNIVMMRDTYSEEMVLLIDSDGLNEVFVMGCSNFENRQNL